MKKLCFSFALILGLAFGATAQSSSEMLDKSYDRDFRLEISTGFGKGINLNSFQATRYIWIGDQNIFNIGSGLRLSNTNIRNLNFSNLGNGKTGLHDLNVNGHIFSLNMYLAAEFAFKGKVSLGVNSDFFGLLFGSLNPVEKLPEENGPTTGEHNLLGAKTPDASYSLFGKNRRGSSLTEVYSSVHIRENVWLKVGVSRVYNQMIMNQALDRFESSSYVFSAGCRLRF